MAHSFNGSSWWKKTTPVASPPFTFTARVNIAVALVFPCLACNSLSSLGDAFRVLFSQGASVPSTNVPGPLITDSAGVTWAITSGAQVSRNGVTLAPTANVIFLAYSGGSVYQENAATHWFRFNPDGTDAAGDLGTVIPFTLLTPDFQFHAVAQTNSGASDDTAKTSGITININTWYHIAAVFASSGSRTMYVNGANSGSSAVSVTPASANLFTLGAQLVGNAPGYFLNGLMANAAIWNIALSAVEVMQHFLGCSPKRLRPEAVVSYPWMSSDTNLAQDLFNSTNWTATGTPVLAANPPGFPP